MVVYLISGSGSGAGKTTLAERLVGESVYSIAGALRHDLKRLHPQYDWFNKSQDYKDNTLVPEYKNCTIRDVLLNHGQASSSSNATYWVDKLIGRLQYEVGKSVIAVDDVRKIVELEQFKVAFPHCYHFHVDYPDAKQEPHFDNDVLKLKADYVVKRRA